MNNTYNSNYIFDSPQLFKYVRGTLNRFSNKLIISGQHGEKNLKKNFPCNIQCLPELQIV
ncbi:hypothetical protein QTP88_026050 [Uroleucon formosanum]